MEVNAQKEVKSIKDFFQVLKQNKVTLLVLLILVAIAYGNLARGNFINMDDEKGILFNPNISNTVYMFKTGIMYNMQLTLIHSLFKLNPAPYHLVSVFLHYINTVVLFLFAYAVFGKSKALISSLLFAVHPLASEAIAWISAVHYIHITFFTLIILMLHYLFKKTENKKYFFAEIGVFLLITYILRNAWVLTVPFSLLVFDQLILSKKLNLKSAMWVLPFFIIGGAFGYIEIFGGFLHRVKDLQQDYYYDPYKSTPILNRTPYIIFMVLKLLLYPVPLTVYHEGIYISRVSYVFMILITVVLVGVVLKTFKKHPYITGLILWIFISTLPSFSPVAIAWFIAERYLYFSTLAFCLVLAFLIPALEKYTGVKKFTTYAVALLLIFYTVRSAIRTNDFLSTRNLWFATQKVSPYSFRVYNNLGDVYAKEGNYEKSIENFKKSIELDPTYADAVHNLGYVYLEMGDYENAQKYLEQSYQMNPRLYGATYKLGVIAFYRNDLELAKAYWEKTLELNPGDSSATGALATVNEILSRNE